MRMILSMRLILLRGLLNSHSEFSPTQLRTMVAHLPYQVIRLVEPHLRSGISLYQHSWWTRKPWGNVSQHWLESIWQSCLQAAVTPLWSRRIVLGINHQPTSDLVRASCPQGCPLREQALWRSQHCGSSNLAMDPELREETLQILYFARIARIWKPPNPSLKFNLDQYWALAMLNWLSLVLSSYLCTLWIIYKGLWSLIFNVISMAICRGKEIH